MSMHPHLFKPRPAGRLAAAALAGLLMLSFGAQAQDSKASKEREALRRAQTALRAAQEQQSGLQAEKAKAEASADAASKEAAALRGQVSGHAAKLRAREQELSAAQSQLQELQRNLAQARSEHSAEQERGQGLQAQLMEARRLAAEREQANQGLVALLEARSQSLGDATLKNRQLQELGHDLVRRYLSRGRVDMALLGDPVLGLQAVRTEDEAEKFRAELARLELLSGRAAGTAPASQP
jgi:chromosome segregation ATPase